MKKFASLMTAAVMICTLVGCGNDAALQAEIDRLQAELDSANAANSSEPTTDSGAESSVTSGTTGENAGTSNVTSENADVTSTTSSSSTEQTTAITTTTTSANISTPEEPEETIPSFNYWGEIRNDAWYTIMLDPVTYEQRHYIYHLEDKELIEFEHEAKVVDVSGYCVVFEKSDDSYYVKNIKTGEIYVSTDNNEMIIKGSEENDSNSILERYFVDGTLLVVREDTGFDNPRKWTALLSDEGKWIHEYWDYYQLPYHSEFHNLEWTHYGNGTVTNEYQVYIMNVDTYLQMGYESYPTIPYHDENVVCVDFGNDPYYVASRSLYAYNPKTNVELYETSVGNIWDNKVFGRFYIMNSKKVIEGDCIVRDLATSKDTTYPTSAYDSVVPCAITNDMIMFECKGGDGNKYFCAINSKGDRIMEPVLAEGLYYACTLSNGNIIMYTSNGDLKVINGKTGDISDIDVDYRLVRFGGGSDMAIVMAEGENAPEEYYYLVDLKDPTTVIDPFNCL